MLRLGFTCAVLTSVFVASATVGTFAAEGDQPLSNVSAVVAIPDMNLESLTPADSPALLGHARIRLTGVPLAASATQTLELERVDVFAADATLIEQTTSGARPLPRPEIAMFRSAGPDGTTRAFLSVSAFGVYGVVRTPAAQLIISTGPAGGGAPLVVRDVAEIVWAEGGPAEPCGVQDGTMMVPGFEERPLSGGIAGGEPPCRRARIAIDTDNEMLDLFGDSPAATTAYIAALIGAVSEVYMRDVNTRIEIGYLRLWTAADPWNELDTGAQLQQYRSYWNTNETGVVRTMAHFLSGRGLGGGIAYLGALCYPEYDYGLSANLDGFFPYPIQHNSDSNWDLMVVAHELGHNFGAPHTHNMSPPVDCCGGAYGGNCGGVQDCSAVPNGTIMSYCHICPSGMSNVRMEFHPRTINEEILPFLDDNDEFCDLRVSSTFCSPPAPCDIVFTSQPQSLSRAPGEDAVFVVAVNAAPPVTYQWRKGASPIAGATSSVLYIDGVTPGDAGTYTCAVTAGCGNEISAAATLTVTSGGCPGARADGNCNGVVDFFDIDPFLLALFNPSSYVATFCGGSICTVDTNCDGTLNFFDIDPFLTCVFSGCANCP